MTNTSESSKSSGSEWRPSQVYIMAAVCLTLGVALGYLFRGSQTQARSTSAPSQAASAALADMPQQMPSLDAMKRMADTKAASLLAQLKSDPGNVDLLKQVAKIYEATHQFQEAAGYYGKAADINPKDIEARTEEASCLYYAGDVDGALTQLQQATQEDPSDANSLFNLGMIRWKGKNDTRGALQAWKQLLKSNPKLESDKKQQVEKLIAQASHGSTD